MAMAGKGCIARRDFLGVAASFGMIVAGPVGAGTRKECFLSSRGVGRQAQAVLFDLERGIRTVQELPGRGHGLALRPGHREVAVVGRRPGLFLAVLNSADGRLLRALTPPNGRWFNGHAAYSADGSLLFTSESGDDGDWIGRWAANERYTRLAEWPCHGVEPHEIALSPQGQWLAIANGGLRYDAQGAVLEQPGACSTLVWLNIQDGALERALTLPAHAADLSLRHFALLSNGAALVGLQAYGHRAEPRPLLALGHPKTGLKLLKLPPLPALNYVGSVVANGPYAALSCPRGNFIALLDLRQERLVRRIDIADACGLAPLAHGFVATSGQGGALVGSEKGVEDLVPASQLPGAWDNHLIAL